ncbi:MAG TPA: carbamoyltransferase HypF [Stellaceae bacterium]|nr:carbamoyltransferase HypF [Stellaceae bacterium]
MSATVAFSGEASVERLRLEIAGAVQGVGFRPFVYRLARSQALRGFVRNTGGGVLVEVEGESPALGDFLAGLDGALPANAAIRERRTTRLAPRGETEFSILPSAEEGARAAVVMADLATCPACLREILDPGDRRYLYPFTSCVDCGPRYSIVEALPYDRARTTMRHFPLCDACGAEYRDPASRRFHAEANACPDCGPRLALWDGAGATSATGHAALLAAVAALRDGAIVALKGLGGFQLLVDAGNEAAVALLRRRKRRPAKPFALMMPSLAAAEAIAVVAGEQRRLLTAPAAPILLLRGRADAAALAPSVAPGNPWLGIMLPYTPLHHLLLRAFGAPLVATSGNLSGEPLVADEAEALQRLGGIADLFLVHDRPIACAVDDSVIRCIAGEPMVLRRARGLAPMPIAAPGVVAPLLALGGQQKNAVATGFDGQIFLGPHIGDLHGPEGRAAFARAVPRLAGLHGLQPYAVACDAHPDFHSSRVATEYGAPVHRVPHHLAHVLAGMVDNGLDGPVLGVAWDGAGYGGDGTIWGGEFLALEGSRFRRVAHFHPFRLPGGEAAIREPRRPALGALYAAMGESGMDGAAASEFSARERAVIATMLARGVNAPLTSSVGRLFDAVASLLGLCRRASFEGEAAMAVEFAADRGDAGEVRLAPLALREGHGPILIDWRPMLADIVAARRRGVAVEPLAAAFHDALAAVILAVARRVGIGRVLLTGGCFQNARLSEAAIGRLRQAGLVPCWHHRVPPNDGGLAVGQLAFAARPLTEEKS